jgi:hypothetical protein
MSVVVTCSDMCGRFLTCVEASNPSFMGTTNALVPCENTCFSLSETARGDLRACYTKTCAEFIACAMSANLMLMQKPKPDASAQDFSIAPDLSNADLSNVD